MSKKNLIKFYNTQKSLGRMCPYKEYYRTAHYDCCEDRIEFICIKENSKTNNHIITDWSDLCSKCSYLGNN